eukprot:gene10018-biopygen13812
MGGGGGIDRTARPPHLPPSPPPLPLWNLWSLTGEARRRRTSSSRGLPGSPRGAPPPPAEQRRWTPRGARVGRVTRPPPPKRGTSNLVETNPGASTLKNPCALTLQIRPPAPERTRVDVDGVFMGGGGVLGRVDQGSRCRGSFLRKHVQRCRGKHELGGPGRVDPGAKKKNRVDGPGRSASGGDAGRGAPGDWQAQEPPGMQEECSRLQCPSVGEQDTGAGVARVPSHFWPGVAREWRVGVSPLRWDKCHCPRPTCVYFFAFHRAARQQVGAQCTGGWAYGRGRIAGGPTPDIWGARGSGPYNSAWGPHGQVGFVASRRV